MARGGKREGAGRKPNPDAKPKEPKLKVVAKAKVEKASEPKTTEEPKKNGRPKEYSNDDYFAVLLRMESGETLAAICAEDGTPSESSVRMWKNSCEEYLLAYTRAREEQQHSWADQIVEIADDATNDYVEKVRKDGSKQILFDKEAVMRSQLRVDTRKWLMARLAPKSYGDKTALELSGKGGAPLIPVINVTIGGTEPQPAS